MALDALIGVLRQAQVGLAEAKRVLGIVRRERDHGAVGLGQARDPAGPLAGVGELQVGGDLARHQPHRLLEIDQGVGRTAERDQAGTGKQPGRTEGRVEGAGAMELGDRGRVLAAPLQHDAEVVVDEGTVAAVAQHGAERGFGLVERSALEGGDAGGETAGERRRQVRALGVDTGGDRHEAAQHEAGQDGAPVAPAPPGQRHPQYSNRNAS